MDYRDNPQHRVPHHIKWTSFAPPGWTNFAPPLTLGLRFLGDVKLEMKGTLTSVQHVLDQAKALPIDGLLRTLSTYHDFGDNDVKYAGEDLTAAHERMIEVLRVVLHSEEKKLEGEK